MKIRRIFCRHKHVRCVHFREMEQERIIHKKKRVVVRCEDCESYLYRKSYPEICFLTKKEHW